MGNLGYDWTGSPTRQYVDGHERADIVDYRQNVFLPEWSVKQPRLRTWLEDKKDEPVNVHQPARASPPNRHTVFWYYYENDFDVHDRHERWWVAVTENPVPRPCYLWSD